MPSPPPTRIPSPPGKLPVIGHSLSLMRDPLAFMESLRPYGDVVRVSIGRLPVYVVTSSSLVHHLLVAEAGNVEKGMLFDKVRPLIGNGVFTSNGAFHMRQRRLLQPAFHRDRIAGYTRIMSEETARRAGEWRPRQVLDVQREIFDLTLKIIAATLFATDHAREVVAEFQQNFPRIVAGIGWRTIAPTPLVERLPVPANRRFNEATRGLRRAVQETIARYRADGRDHGDILSMLLAAKDERTGEGMSDEEIHDEVIALLVGGTESTALTLSWLFYELGRHPELDARLHAEIRTVLGDRRIGFEDVGEMTFVRALITETLRLHHPIWIVMRRARSPIDLGGVRIPRGAEIVFSPHTQQLDPGLFPEPHRFEPGRWLSSSAPVPRESFLPFGAGRRVCLGDAFAWTEMTVTVTTIAAHWSLTPAPGSRVRPLALATVYPRDLRMVLDPRPW
ncbi:cytochrome P450 [Actinomadura sp. NPDC048955]|uniref:cytochrome P450 n=1 Tax=Actinomadura sp. NPDC048955 TaxID=3158228 RepID=UPI0033C26C48